jgi:hypothetical protein
MLGVFIGPFWGLNLSLSSWVWFEGLIFVLTDCIGLFVGPTVKLILKKSILRLSWPIVMSRFVLFVLALWQILECTDSHSHFKSTNLKLFVSRIVASIFCKYSYPCFIINVWFVEMILLLYSQSLLAMLYFLGWWCGSSHRFGQ